MSLAQAIREVSREQGLLLECWSSSSAAARLTWVEVMSSPQSSWTMAVTFRVLTPWEYISATARVIARWLRTPRSRDNLGPPRGA